MVQNTKKTNFSQIVRFKTTGYDSQIDYIKGICILFVIWTHCMDRKELGIILFPYWGDTAVPIFLIIQVFHYYKKGIDLRMPDTIKLWKRIIRPFIIMVALMFISQFFIYYDITEGAFSPSLYWDKRGPGSYYIFVYLELAFIIPLLSPLFKKHSNKCLFVIFIILSQIIEFITSISHCPDFIYRILFIRYIFLVYIGYLLATKGMFINKLSICAIIISIVFIYIFNYTNINLEPVFYTSICNWRICHWICYIYIAYFFIWLLKQTYEKIYRFTMIRTFIEDLGKYSFEIFLFQIFYYATINIYVNKLLSLFTNYSVHHSLYITLSTIICIMPVVLYKKYFFNRKNN